MPYLDVKQRNNSWKGKLFVIYETCNITLYSWLQLGAWCCLFMMVWGVTTVEHGWMIGCYCRRWYFVGIVVSMELKVRISL